MEFKVTKVTTRHEVTLSVEYFEQTEGGMETESFGGECRSIQDAIRLWDLAMASDAKTPSRNKPEWLIVMRPKVSVILGTAEA